MTVHENIQKTQQETLYTIRQSLTDSKVNKMQPATIRNRVMKTQGFSILTPTDTMLYHNYPKGSELFDKNAGNLAQKFDTLVAQLQQNPKLISFFRKIHINVLNELYEYLMKIYTTFNLRHVGITQTAQGTLSIDVPTCLTDDFMYATNKKTLVVNHLVNLIEAQFNSAIQSYINIPHLTATTVGKSMIQSDFSIDLTHFILKQESEILQTLQQTYLQFLTSYIDFFQGYTSYLAQHDATTGLNQFVALAKKIHAYIHQDGADQALANMNPAMFFFDFDTMRAVSMIPQLAKDIPQGTHNVTWPDQIVQAATLRQQIDNHPIAYFKDNMGNITTDVGKAAHLYVVTASGADLYQQEALMQPNWLNTSSGVMNILRACMGDFSALLSMNILDPCMEALISNAVAIKNGTQPTFATAQICQALTKSYQDKDVVVSTSTQPATTTPTIPVLPSGITTNSTENNNDIPALDGLNTTDEVPSLPGDLS